MLASSLTASLDRNVVPLGESVTLSLVFEGGAPGGSPNLPELRGFTIAPGISQRSEFSFVNGQQSVRQIYEYTLMPAQLGELTIPSLQIRVGNQVLTSQPLTVKAVKGNVPGGGEAAATNLAFLRLIVPKNEVYLGEAFPIEIQLYCQSARDVQRPQLKAEGFTLGQSAEPAQSRTMVNGVAFNVVVFRLTAIAAKTGTFNLGPAECNLTVLVPANNRGRRRDPFSDPFSDFFGPSAQPRPTTLLSEAQSLKVLPLPSQNVPATFNGAVGSFQMNVSAGPTNLTVGDPLTVKVQITGNGQIDSLSLPDQPQWRDFKIYPPTATNELRDPLGLSGSKFFTQVLIPQHSEINVLPAFQFSFFDPQTRNYRTLTGPALPVTVQASAARTTPVPSLATNASPNPLPADDLVNIRTRLDHFGSPEPLLAQQPWFISLQGVPVLAWLSLLIWRKRREALANNPRLRRQREVARRVREGLNELRVHAATRAGEQFFAALFRMLQEQLGERLDLPASAITEAVIDERLRGSKLSPDTVSNLQELFQTCNAARYAPNQTSQKMEALIPQLECALRDLQTWQP